MLVHVSTTASTNADAGALARDGAPHGAAVWADQQTAGRGRLGRVWESPQAGNVYLSVVLRPAVPAHRLALLCLGAAVVVAELAGPAYRIKWPNDVLAPDGRKVAGILAEAEFDGGAPKHVILGVGVNLNHAPPLGTATSLAEVDGARREVEPVVRALIDGVLAVCRDVEQRPADVLARWRRQSHTLGKHVRINTIEGVARDVDTSGALLVETSGGLERVLAGDVELVKGAP